MQTVINSEKRAERRTNPDLTMTVKKRNGDSFYKETTRSLTLTRRGASFNLKEPCAIGQLVSLLIPMPAKLRCYDFKNELYRVWGIVQHCTPISYEDFTGYHIGTAFIGKDAPPSYIIAPEQSYRIVGVDSFGLWKISEVTRSFITRKDPRFWKQLDAKIDITQAEGQILSVEATTQNISIRGAAVICNLEVVVGDEIKFSCPDLNFSTLATIRSRQVKEDEPATLHIEFIENEFPVKSLDQDLSVKQAEPEAIEDSNPE